ncbi:efflux RND transporter periplasmic adaptor subunit [Sphingomonas montanisoli]|uniref:Efflux RND transporter periplasmic adaptor subunit n=1 Tax=Sphingomonas montanisoli TaxID=2606412 RepID=A0A5D9C9A4_9SPHN|nr:efflux RND transporter periplasmic adaptor subunit [Sphingomonas montanisoli]TZG27976.1 efflux RND transporter periplasmic adaptor subunit [Sphingomonas montanisoli]
MNAPTHITPPETVADAPEKRPLPIRLVIGAAAVLIAAIAWFLFHRGQPAMAMPTPVVTVASPIAREVTEWDSYVGRFAASQSVEVRPRVAGQIVARHFTDGDTVRKGAALFTIDPRPFTAALAEARAAAASARSTLALARADLARADRLKGDEALSTGELDGLRARVQAAEAGLAGADARIRARALDVEFTVVRAPITGRVSDRRVDIGNLVAGGEGGAATLLTTINALDPIYFGFDASEALFLKAQRHRQAGAPAPTVEVRLQDEPDYRWKGKINFTDNGLDNRSGTIRGRAVLDNPKGFLTPGMFGNMRLANADKVRALLVPDAAVQTDQARKILFVVAKDGTIAAKPVVLGPVVDGLRVIRSGADLRDRVVIEGMQSVMPGAKVDVKPGRFAPDKEAAPAAISAPASAQATFAR